MKNCVLVLAIITLSLWPASAQMQEGQGPRRMPGEGVMGKVTAVAADSVTVAPAKGGDAVVVKIADDTRIIKERQPIKIAEIKVGDSVMARGQLAGTTLQARMLAVVNPEMIERMQQGGGFGMGMGAGQGQFKPEDWGKTFVAGRVKGINETTLTISNPNSQQTLNIEVDENTSFKKGRDSITLADIKADDFVVGPGEVKNGVFVAKELRVGGGRMMQRGAAGEPGAAAGQPKQDSEKPAAPPQN